MDSVLAKPNYAGGQLKVILLAGLRGSGKSLCGRALQNLLSCGYLDLDEGGVNGPCKFEFFYRNCLKKIMAEGGLWIIDKLGPYSGSARTKFLREVRAAAHASILLKFVHTDHVEELRICYFRFSRRGVNHRNGAFSDEDVFININFEQAQRRGPQGKNFNDFFLQKTNWLLCRTSRIFKSRLLQLLWSSRL